MRILWVKAGKLLPIDTGGKIRSYNLLRQLANRHQLTLLSYYPGEPDPSYDAEIASHFPGAVALATGGGGDSAPGAALHYLVRAPRLAPYAVSKFTSPRVARLVRQWLDEQRFDVAICDFLSASLNFPASSPTPRVLFQHNVETFLWERQARHEPSLVRRLVYQYEYWRMRRYEARTVGRFDHVIAVSQHDRDGMLAMTPGDRITVVPTGVDVAKYGATGPSLGTTDEVIFLGSMDWEANVDGAEYFCREIWPRVTAVVPSARFMIVGRNPAPRVKRLASPAVEVTGSVESVLPYLARAAVFVVPLRIGGGTRLKIFEGMAMGKATVSTTIGAEGLDVTNGEDLILADDPQAFAQAVVDLLKDPEKRQRFGAAAARLAQRYDWSVVVRTFEHALERAGASGTADTPELARVQA
jgi:glycosyltransferase involved in cell wall biosynthesis